MLTRFLLWAPAISFLAGCSSAYKDLAASAKPAVASIYSNPLPDTSIWYRASVDIVGNHLSGLLLIKSRNDSARIVFTNESGFKFFDFEFGPTNYFKKHSVLPQMDKKAVIRTLQNDFLLVIGYPFRSPNLQYFQDGRFQYIASQYDNKLAYLVYPLDSKTIDHLELASKRKKLVTLTFEGKSLQAAESIKIEHHTFNMQIQLSKLKTGNVSQ
ncbi:MAG: hypothetical protein ABIV51_12765 [Saprospiraceae bacterium]